MSAAGGLAKRSHEENWLPILELAIQEVFEIMLGCQVNPVAPSEHQANAEFTAMVRLSCGTYLLLTMTIGLARMVFTSRASTRHSP